MWGEETLMICWEEYKLVQSQWSNSMGVSQKNGNVTTIQSCNSPCWHTSKGTKSGCWRHVCTTVFITVLFTIAKTWEQPQCSSKDEWIKNDVICILYIYHICAMHSHSFMSDSLLPHGWTVAHQAPLSIGILQARILEWVAMPSSRGSS